MSIKIVVDSTANIRDDIEHEFSVVPVTIRFGEEEYIDGVTLSNKQFYEKLIECDELPATSQPTPDSFGRVFKEAIENGDEILVITISTKLSGTYQSAMIAARDFPGKVHVIDSKSVAIGAGILAEYALNLVKQGMEIKEIAEKLEIEKENIRLIALLDTLEYLKRGGRISTTTAIAGTLLSIKPVINISDGAVEILGKARGSKQGNNLLIKEIQASGGVDFNKPLLLGYTGIDDSLLQKYIRDSAFLWENNVEKLNTTIVSGAVGTHTGPGVVAAAFFKGLSH